MLSDLTSVPTPALKETIDYHIKTLSFIRHGHFSLRPALPNRAKLLQLRFR
jgi:hypothetical protein